MWESRTQLESWTEEGESPVSELNICELSRAEPVKLCLNMPAPSGKAKYY